MVDTNPVFAYWIDTHALLTKEAIEFYSQKAATSTIKEFSDYLIDGARKEDDVPRWMNHFYDPVYDRGLTQDSKIDPFYVLGNWNKSKDWVVSSDLQNQIKYKVPTTVASILTAIQRGKISSLTTKTDFTWNEALYFWINGEKEKAMFALGHIIHLIQDASVPDHTRNDPHPEGSIYEKWTSQFSLDSPDKNLLSKIKNKNLISFDNLGSYFDELAKYSNNNFYSKDTIGIQSGYDLPEMESIEKNGDYYYGYKRDDLGNIYYISVYKNYRGSLVSGTINNISLKVEDEDGVVSGYWSLLSPKAVQYSASVIDLFFKEAERLKDDPQFAKKESFFAQVIDVAGNIISAITGAVENVISTVKDNTQIQDPNLLASVSLDGDAELNKQEVVDSEPINDLADQGGAIVLNDDTSNLKEEVLVEGIVKEDPNIIIDESWQKAGQETSSSTQYELLNKDLETNSVQEQNIKTCSFETTKIATHKDLLINEVAWMGSVKSSSDEWVELKNISGSELDISNWQIIDKGEQIKIIFPVNTKISVGGFLLLERTDDSSVSNAKADAIYTGALSNSDEGLRLFDSQCNLIDDVLASSDWLAGDSSTKRTMERQSDLTWLTYSGSGEGIGDLLILGTPKKENSVKVIYGGSVTVNSINENQSTVQDTSQPSKILISEVQITGGTGKTNNDFIELYNPNDTRVNLKGYRLVKRTKTGTTDTSIKSWTTDAFIEAKGFYLWANSDYTDISTAPDVVTTGSLANDNGVALRYGSEDTGTVIDSVAWGAAENVFIESSKFSTNPGANESIQRKIESGTFIDTDNNADDFESRICPSPKLQSRSCGASTNQAPSAFFDLSTTTPKTGEEIIFNAASSTDPDGQIILYEWNFGDSQLASTTQATTTHSYILSGNYRTDLIVYDNNNATSTMSVDLLVATSTPTKVSNFLAQYDKPNRQINLSWDASQDFSGATTTLDYKITDVSSVPVLSDINTSLTTATTSISQLGRDYIFSIQAFDEYELSSEVATTSVYVDETTIEETNYLMVNNQTETYGTVSGTVAQVFKPLAIGVINSATLNIRTGNSGYSDVVLKIYDWLGDGTATSTSNKGQLLAQSNIQTISASTAAYYPVNLSWSFSGVNRITLNNDRYYLLETEITPISGDLRLDWAKTNSSSAIDGVAFNNSTPITDLYTSVGAVSTGVIEITNPVNNYIYENTSINLGINYIEPMSNEYNSLVVSLKDFYTNVAVSDSIISLTTDQKSVGLHSLDPIALLITNPGFLTLTATLANCTDSCELSNSSQTVNFSVTGAQPTSGTIINQTAFVNNLSASSVAQSFKPMVNGQLNSITLKLSTGGNGWNYTSLKVYEWIGGQSNSSEGTKGQLLATSESKMIWNSSLPGEGGNLTWDFSGENEINLESGSYYYLESVVDSQSNGGAPNVYFRGQSNDSLIDGKLYSGNIGGDLYLIINKKEESPSL